MCMRKFQSFAFAGAIALAGAAGLTACSSDDAAEAPINPTFDGESVKTAFAISIATPQGNGTRMSATNTQNGRSAAFLGMENIKLIPLATTNSVAPSAKTSFSQIISLTNLDNKSAGLGITGTSTADFHKVYNDVNIATGTNNFLFYGTSPLNVSKKFELGSIVSTFPEIGSAAANHTAAEVKFALDVISTTDFSRAKADFANYLNTVAAARYDDSNVWSGVTDDENRSLSTAYQTFTKANVLRGGSAAAVLATMQELYNVIKSLVPDSEPTTGNKVQKVAWAIKNAITGSSSVAVTINDAGILSWAASMSEEYKSFPTKYDLPEGAAEYKYSGGAFAYVEGPVVGSSTTPNNNAIAVKNIAYPLPLTYFANTPLKALDSEFNSWKTSSSDWEADASWTSVSWYDAVTPTTRTVALRNNINYGVACLNTKVICAANKLVDNNTENPTQVAVPTEGFKVTGVLVGGQPKEVNWQFVDETAISPARDMVVFDNDVNIKAAVASDFTSAKSNYTLVFDNYCTTADLQKKVNVAIELVNESGQEFVGVDGNKVAKGQTFYLVGQLDASSPKTSANWPTGLPGSYTDRYPVKGGTAGSAINRVFVQAYTTTANFKITSLKNAYVTIPDLRAANLQLGLSVDLTWQTGLTFEVEL